MVERNILAQREVDVYRRDLQAFASENAKMMAASSAQAKSESKRRQALQMTCNTERHYEERINEEQHERRLKQLTITQNEQIIGELNNQAKDEERRKREIQRICEESPELRDLEKMLKQAYLNKERDVQYQDKVLQEERERERNRAIEDQMEYDRIMALEKESGKDEQKRAQMIARKTVLERQLREREEARLLEAKNKEKEKEMVDEIVQKIVREDTEEAEARRKTQQDNAKAMREFKMLRDKELAERRRRELEEEEEMRAFNRAIEARSHGLAAKKQAKRDEDDRIFKKIVEEAEAKRREEEEFNSLRDMLWEEELEAKRAADAAGRREKQERMKKDMMRANEQMLKIKGEMKVRDAEQEERIIALMKAKFAKDEAMEREEEANRQRSKMKHLSLIEKQRAERQLLSAQEAEREAALQAERDEREEFRKKVVAEARKRLLAEHAEKLGGYMPGTAFADRDEFSRYTKK
jgi:hypothetical protein